MLDESQALRCFQRLSSMGWGFIEGMVVTGEESDLGSIGKLHCAYVCRC